MDYGKQAARNIDERLMGENRWDADVPRVRVRPEGAGRAQYKSRRHTSHSVSVNVRVKSHDEVVPGLEPEEALEEACRCLRCDIRTHVSVS